MDIQIKSLQEYESLYIISFLSADIAYETKGVFILYSDPYVYHCIIDDSNLNKYLNVLKSNVANYYSRIIFYTDDVGKIKLLEKYL